MGKEIGIDFGTTTTEVSYIDGKGHSKSLRLESNSAVIPTVLYFESENDYRIGLSASRAGSLHPESCVRNFKLHLTDSTKKYHVIAENGDEFTIKPRKVAQLFLNALIQIIQPRLLELFGAEDGVIDKAVITVPAQFDPEEKAAIKYAITRAAEQAGFSDIKIAAEPTAAAVAYQEENGDIGETILVYDFGGGTFDVSVIQRVEDLYTEIATDGDKHLGGNLLTEKIAEVLWEQCLAETDICLPFEQEEADAYDPEEYEMSYVRFQTNRFRVFEAAEAMKCEMAEEEESDQGIPFFTDNENDPKILLVHMTEAEFNNIIRKDVMKTVDVTRRVLKEVHEKKGIEKVDQIVLAGGSSQIRLIRELMEEDESIRDLAGDTAEPGTLIARGAARLASVELITGERTRFEIGTRATDGRRLDLFVPIIGVDEVLPCRGSQVFYLPRENQNEITVEYYEKDIKNYPRASRIDDDGINLVSELTISGIPPLSDLAVKVTFQIEVDGTPTVIADVLDADGGIIQSDQLSVSRKGNLF